MYIYIKGRLSDKSIDLIVKKYIGALGLNENELAAHSLRSVLSTSAAMMGMADIAIMKQTGHITREMVDRYVQSGTRYNNNSSCILKNI
ncbi:tyrosine-type recombinase/integrase [Peribacillus butanolivorans]|uniref:tyrosine-type recombinase/integrase n=1 Tax=Peribacillus butanolivorans TaxID=421767 RepID=UPI0037FE5B65